MRLSAAHPPIRSAFRLALLALLLVLGGCAGAKNERTAVDWPTSTPRAEGLDPGAIRRYVRRIEAGAYGDIHSLLVVRNGRLAVERYFGGYDRETLHPVYSVTKSVTSLLVGQASDEGIFPEPSTRLLPLFPEYSQLRRVDARKRAITLDDVLTMRAGFRWDELRVPYDDPRNPVARLLRSPDWLRFVLDLPMASASGTEFRYNSGCSILLGGVLRKATKVTPEVFAERELFAPLGIDRYEWESGPNGVTNTGWGLSLRPRDLAKLGQLVLDGGEWRGERLVSEGWLEASTARRVRLRADVSYGYQWWLLRGAKPGDADLVVALGWGGQLVVVAPRLDVVVVSTAADYESGREGALAFIRPFLRDVVEE